MERCHEMRQQGPAPHTTVRVRCGKQRGGVERGREAKTLLAGAWVQYLYQSFAKRWKREKKALPATARAAAGWRWIWRRKVTGGWEEGTGCPARPTGRLVNEEAAHTMQRQMHGWVEWVMSNAATISRRQALDAVLLHASLPPAVCSSRCPAIYTILLHACNHHFIESCSPSKV